ncbi:MAG: hypothetical protein WBW31_05210 [Candidatus Sulfotelmatobacter sp.]
MPGETLDDADIVSCCGVPTDKEKLGGDTLTPDGGVVVICALPENPFSPFIEMIADCVPPGAITTVAGCVDKEKSG